MNPRINSIMETNPGSNPSQKRIQDRSHQGNEPKDRSHHGNEPKDRSHQGNEPKDRFHHGNEPRIDPIKETNPRIDSITEMTKDRFHQKERTQGLIANTMFAIR